MDDFLTKTKLDKSALFTTLGRTAARMIQARAIAKHGLEAFYSLIENIKVDQDTYTSYKIDKNKEYKGRFIGDVPRGMLSHWIRIKNGVVENYQAVVPSTWNAGPIDAKGQVGPYEASLIGLKVADISQPLEIIRVRDNCLFSFVVGIIISYVLYAIDGRRNVIIKNLNNQVEVFKFVPLAPEVLVDIGNKKDKI